ncbi:MAG: type II toxin-antitoxin system RelB/DinJ family antitoxin [Caldilineaceae bacterium]
MTYASVQARIKPELKAQADEIFESIGISTADAIRMFLQQTVNVGGLPFTPTAKRPNPTLRAAMDELENGGGEVFDTPEALFAEWKAT